VDRSVPDATHLVASDARLTAVQWGTCGTSAIMPLNYLCSLLEADYGDSEWQVPRSAKDAVDQWLFASIAGAAFGGIGGQT
jgi:hypothetical protein